MAQDPASFSHGLNIGDRVQVMGDEKRVKQLQVDHGGWVDAMGGTIGQKGKIARLYQDGDVRVEVNGSSWTYNPACLRVTERAPPGSSQPTGTTTTPTAPPLFSSSSKPSTYSYPSYVPTRTSKPSVPVDLPKQASYLPPKPATASVTPGEKPTCIVCFEDFDDDQHKVIAFIPCGHTSCLICSKRMSECHVCRKPISTKIPIYM